LITDLDDVVLYANSRICELSGYDTEEMVGRPAYELILPTEQWPGLQERNQQRREGLIDRYEMEAMRKDGSRFWIETNAMSYLDNEGTVVGTLGAITDLRTGGKLVDNCNSRYRTRRSC
jgi:PAS domain S-box-containing protein